MEEAVVQARPRYFSELSPEEIRARAKAHKLSPEKIRETEEAAPQRSPYDAPQ